LKNKRNTENVKEKKKNYNIIDCTEKGHLILVLKCLGLITLFEEGPSPTFDFTCACIFPTTTIGVQN